MSAPRQRMHERRKRSDIIGQILALVAQFLDFGLGRRVFVDTASNTSPLHFYRLVVLPQGG